MQDVIKENGNGDITGDVMQSTLLALINSLGDGYQYKGIASPGDNLGSPDQKVFYFTSTPGLYAGLTLNAGEFGIVFYDSVWHLSVLRVATTDTASTTADGLMSKEDKSSLDNSLSDVNAVRTDLQVNIQFTRNDGSGETIFVQEATEQYAGCLNRQDKRKISASLKYVDKNDTPDITAGQSAVLFIRDGNGYATYLPTSSTSTNGALYQYEEAWRVITEEESINNFASFADFLAWADSNSVELRGLIYINEIGNLADLHTTNKSTIVDAINEIYDRL